jgi:hypothetical protein
MQVLHRVSADMTSADELKPCDVLENTSTVANNDAVQIKDTAQEEEVVVESIPSPDEQLRGQLAAAQRQVELLEQALDLKTTELQQVVREHEMAHIARKNMARSFHMKQVRAIADELKKPKLLLTMKAAAHAKIDAIHHKTASVVSTFVLTLAAMGVLKISTR